MYVYSKSRATTYNDRKDVTKNPMEGTAQKTKNIYKFTQGKLQRVEKNGTRVVAGLWKEREKARERERKKETPKEEGTEGGREREKD